VLPYSSKLLDVKGNQGLWAGTENYSIIIKNYTVCATGVGTMFLVV
jgi:hypothetical protein